MDTDSVFYTEDHERIQAVFDSRGLAERLKQTIVTDEISPDLHQPFIESRDFFFLATVTSEGEPMVSYKGGEPGLVTVLDPGTVAFPLYDGNGMFLSAGNIAGSERIGMLFIDFETPNRVRIQATATVSDDDPLLASHPGALMMVRGRVDSVYLNCARYIHKHRRLEPSPYVPSADGTQPYPSWKRIDFVQDVLRPQDQGRADVEGGIITIGEYAEKLAAGES